MSKKDLALAALALWVLLGVLFVAAIFRWGPSMPSDSDSLITHYKDSVKGLETQRKGLIDSINKTALSYDSLIKNIRNNGDTTSRTLQGLLSKHRQLDPGRN
jgi:DNA integrity scanning protein DisA with diadenylate cyclase activity